MSESIVSRIVLPAVVVGFSILLGACAGGTDPQAKDLARDVPDSLVGYSKVIIDPVDVEFSEHWDPDQTGTHFSMNAKERDELRDEIAANFNQSFREELVSGRLQVVEQAGPDVVRITPYLQDVYLRAPLPYDYPGETYVRNVGHMTLKVVFTDTQSKRQVLELQSKVRGRDVGLLRPASRVFNFAELRAFFKDWAQVVRQELFRDPA